MERIMVLDDHQSAPPGAQVTGAGTGTAVRSVQK